MLRKLENKKTLDYVFVFLCFVLPIIFYWNVIVQNNLMVTGDGINFFVPKFFQYGEIASGEIPLWNGYVISGIPLIADPNNTYFYPLHALALIFPETLYTNLYYVLHLGLAGFFAYLFLKEIIDNRLAAFVGAIVFSSSLIIGGSRREHGWVYTSIIWMPLVLYFIQLFLKTGKKRNIIFSSLAMAVQFFGGNPQLTLYSDILSFFYFFVFLIGYKYSFKEIVKSLFIWIGSYLLFAAISLIPMAELIVFSSRAAASDIFCLLSTSWELLLMMLFPTIFGQNLAHPFGYYGSGEISIELYLGIIPLTYALYTMRYYFSNRFVKFAAAAIVIGFLYSSACNIPLIGSVIQKIPLLNYFRVQSRVLFIFAFFSICCFAYGFTDIAKPERIKRLLRFNGGMLLGIVFVAVIIAAIGRSPMGGEGEAAYLSITAKVFRATFLIAAFNLIVIGFLYLLREQKRYFQYASILMMLLLLAVTLRDLGRYSWAHSAIPLNTLMDTKETEVLKGLLAGEPYRVTTAYDFYGEEDYSRSGLLNNWSMRSHIRNLKGRTEFNNPSLDELLVQSESRDNANINKLVADPDILSMLAVKYVLMPFAKGEPQSTPQEPEKEILSRPEAAIVPGDGNVFVDSIPVTLDVKRYYQVSFEVNSTGQEDDQFYVDFYGGPKYDWVEQQQAIPLEAGKHIYSTVLYSGDEALPEEISFRMVNKSNNAKTISNLKIVRLVPATRNPDYALVAHTDRYNIYELKPAQKLLYIPGEVKSIKDEVALRKKPEDFPALDQISYVKNFKTYKTGGTLDILSVKNNSLTARVDSPTNTFVNHSQSFYPGWKAYIDGKETPIYLVNGVIQGIEVPSGEHTIKFVYDPLSLKAGAAITFFALIIAILLIIFRKW